MNELSNGSQAFRLTVCTFAVAALHPRQKAENSHNMSHRCIMSTIHTD